MVSFHVECPICFHLINKKLLKFISPCGHCLCEKCGEQWLDSNPSCPICRQDVLYFSPWNHKNKKILKTQDQDIGITLTKHKKGLEVTKIIPGYLADRSGLLEGDIINYINGIHFRNPSSAIKLITLAKTKKFTVQFTLIYRKSHFC
jgi:hypothetical protein